MYDTHLHAAALCVQLRLVSSLPSSTTLSLRPRAQTDSAECLNSYILSKHWRDVVVRHDPEETLLWPDLKPFTRATWEASISLRHLYSEGRRELLQCWADLGRFHQVVYHAVINSELEGEQELPFRVSVCVPRGLLCGFVPQSFFTTKLLQSYPDLFHNAGNPPVGNVLESTELSDFAELKFDFAIVGASWNSLGGSSEVSVRSHKATKV